MKHSIKISILALALYITPTANAESATFSFSGGNESPLSVTFTNSFILTLNIELSNHVIALEFDGIYPTADGDGIFRSISPISYSVNSVPAGTENQHILNYSAPSTDPRDDDLALILGGATYPTGSVVSFSMQTVTTTLGWSINPNDFAQNFSIFIIDSTGIRVSDIISATGSINVIPEPSTYAKAAGLIALFSAYVRRSKFGRHQLRK